MQEMLYVLMVFADDFVRRTCLVQIAENQPSNCSSQWVKLDVKYWMEGRIEILRWVMFREK